MRSSWLALLLLAQFSAGSPTENEDGQPLYSWSEWANREDGNIERSSLQRVKEVKLDAYLKRRFVGYQPFCFAFCIV